MNVSDLMNLMKNSGNPANFIMSALRNKNTPIANNAADMIQNNDIAGIEKLVRNMCASKGINPDETLRQVKKMFGN